MHTLQRLLLIPAAASVMFLNAMGGAASAQETRSAAEIKAAHQRETAELLKVIESGSLTAETTTAFERLATVGTAEAVPVLAAMLGDAKLSHYARYGLEAIPDPSAGAALRKALGQLDGQLLIGVINSVGARRDAQAVPALANRLDDKDPQVATAAAAALGRIANAESAKSLLGALAGAAAAHRAGIADGCLICAEHLSKSGGKSTAMAIYDRVRAAEVPKNFRLAALRGAILAREGAGTALMAEQLHADDFDVVNIALRTARELPSADVVRTLISSLGSLPPRKRALALLVLGDLGDSSGLGAVMTAAESGPAEVRLAAVRSLRRIGNATSVPVLWKAALDPDEPLAAAARQTLRALPGEKVDAAIVNHLRDQDAASLSVAIELAGRRHIAAAVPALLHAAQNGEPEVRLLAIQALGGTIALDKLNTLVQWMAAAQTEEEKAATQTALKAACVRMPDRDACAEQLVRHLDSAPAEAKTVLLEQLGAMGGSVALKCLADNARDSSPDTQDDATRILGEWIGSDVSPVLLDLAKTLKNNKYKIRVLRGYIRIANQFGLPDQEKIQMCRNALEIAQRDDERKLVFTVLTRNPSPASLRLAVSQLQVPSVKNQAANVSVNIAQRVVLEQPKDVAAAMQKVLDAGVRGGTAGRAKELLRQAKAAGGR